MCDEITERENAAYLEQRRLSRRELSLGAGAAMVTALAGCGGSAPAASEPEAPGAASARPPEAEPSATETPQPESAPEGLATRSRMVTVDTPDGQAEAFFVTPKSGKHPGVILWPDVAGLRPAFEKMATRLAAEGYAVLAVNCYYRSSKLPILQEFSEWRTDEGKAKIAPMRKALTAEAITKDGAAFAAWLDEQDSVDTAKKIGTMGYCMSGPFTFRTAAAAPERVGVMASFHGGGLVTEEADSPHKLLSKMKAAALICIAKNDHERQPEAKPELEKAAAAAKIQAEIEVYPAMHGWCALDSPVFDEKQANRAWARALATFDEYL